MYSQATIIANPRAGAGRVLRLSAEILREARKWAKAVEFFWTRAEGDGIELAKKAVVKGSELIISLGGDGTVNEVVNGLVVGRRETGRDCVLGIIPVGTSCALAKQLGISRGLPAVKLMAKGATKTIDLMRLRWLTRCRDRKERFATTIAHFGFGGAVARMVGSTLKELGGFLAFAVGATFQLFRYRGEPMLIEVDQKHAAQPKVFSAIVANTQWEGGGMRVAPEARPDDGVLDIIVVEDVPLLSRLKSFPKVYKGTHVGLPFVTSWMGRKVMVKGERVLPFEFDGEWAECRECFVEVVPAALKVLVPQQAAGA